MSDEDSYESSNTQSGILEKLNDRFKSFNSYWSKPEKEVITDTGENEEDSEESDDGGQNLATNDRIGDITRCECS